MAQEEYERQESRRIQRETDEKFRMVQEILLAKESQPSEIDQWAALSARYLNKQPQRHSSNHKDDGDEDPTANRRDSTLKNELDKHGNSAETVVSTSTPSFTIQDSFTHPKFDQTHRFTFAKFRDLVDSLTSFMNGRSRTDRIGPASLISARYFSDTLRQNIANRIRRVRETYLNNIKSNVEKNRLMFELPDFVIKEKNVIDHKFLYNLCWADALAWLEIYFKAIDETHYTKFYNEAIHHIKLNLVQQKYIGIKSTSYLVGDVRTAHLYLQQCLSINPQKHSSSTEDHIVSVTAFPGMKDKPAIGVQGMQTILMSYLPPKLTTYLRKCLSREDPAMRYTLEKTMERIEAFMYILSNSFHQAEDGFMAIQADAGFTRNKDGTYTITKPTFGSKPTHKVNNISYEHNWEEEHEEEVQAYLYPDVPPSIPPSTMSVNKGPPATVNQGPPTAGNLSDLTEEQMGSPNNAEYNAMLGANPMFKELMNDANATTAVNAVANNPMHGYCTRAMFSHKRNNEKCDRADCPFDHSEQGYKNMIQDLAKAYNLKIT